MTKITETLKLQAENEREAALYQMLKDDDEYQAAVENLNSLEQALDTLELTPNQKEVVFSYLQTLDFINQEYSAYSYIAGIKNAGKSKISA